jgi:CubicO group peptidase (beta-lactamase class C family)
LVTRTISLLSAAHDTRLRERRSRGLFPAGGPRRAALLLAGAAALTACGDAPTAPANGDIDLTRPWVMVAPAEVGMDGALLNRAVNRAAQLPRFRTLLVARRGRLVLERYFHGSGAASLNDVRSVTKSIVSTLTGIAQANGFLPNLDTTIAAYLASDYTLDAGDSAVTVRDLLTMTSGYQWNEGTADDYTQWITTTGDHVQYVLDRPRAAPPGTSWTYNSGAVHVLGVLLAHATGTTLPAFADRYLFGPLGIDLVQWEPLDPGTVNGGAGIDLRAQDLLRLGQLFLQGGRSGSRQVVPAAWVTNATTPQFTWRRDFGAQRDITYGYLWWVSDVPGANAYFAWGYGGQFIYVVPSRDLVIVATTDWVGVDQDVGADAMEAAVLDIIVNDLIPAAQ